MPKFTVNAYRFDPYKGFKFRILWDGHQVAGISHMSALRRNTEVVEFREGGDPSASRKSPGKTVYAPIVLERGLTHDLEFERWANKVWSLTNAAAPVGGHEVSLRDFRKNIRIEVLNEAGQIVLAYDVYRCWVSEYRALPDLDASGSVTAIEQITLENEGWVRDAAITEPAEPGYSDPP
jgi:phage tail-like protein